MIYTGEYEIHENVYKFLGSNALRNSRINFAIFSFAGNFSVNTANHVKTPCVSTHVTYRKSYYRKLAAFPMFSPDTESSAVAIVGEQEERCKIPSSAFSSVCVLTVILSACNKRNGFSCG